MGLIKKIKAKKLAKKLQTFHELSLKVQQNNKRQSELSSELLEKMSESDNVSKLFNENKLSKSEAEQKITTLKEDGIRIQKEIDLLEEEKKQLDKEIIESFQIIKNL